MDVKYKVGTAAGWMSAVVLRGYSHTNNWCGGTLSADTKKVQESQFKTTAHVSPSPIDADTAISVRNALLNKDNPYLQKLLKNGLHPDSKIYGHPLLVWATIMENLDFYEDLLAARAQIKVNDKHGSSLSMNALWCRDPIYLFKLLIKGLNPSDSGKDICGKERPLIWWALYKGRLAHFELLHKHGADIDALLKVGNEGDVCAWKLALSRFEKKYLELLLVGRNPNNIYVQHEDKSYSLLAYAKKFGRPEPIAVLKKAGAAEQSACIIS